MNTEPTLISQILAWIIFFVVVGGFVVLCSILGKWYGNCGKTPLNPKRIFPFKR